MSVVRRSHSQSDLIQCNPSLEKYIMASSWNYGSFDKNCRSYSQLNRAQKAELSKTVDHPHSSRLESNHNKSEFDDRAQRSEETKSNCSQKAKHFKRTNRIINEDYYRFLKQIDHIKNENLEAPAIDKEFISMEMSNTPISKTFKTFLAVNQDLTPSKGKGKNGKKTPMKVIEVPKETMY